MKTILILGSSGELGSNLYKSFGEENYNIVGADLRTSENTQFKFDANCSSSIENLFQHCTENDLKLDCVVNLIGKIHNQPFYNVMKTQKYIDDDTWREILAYNLETAFKISKSYHRYCVGTKRKCNMINFSSVTSTGNPGQLLYSIAKAGLETLTKTLARELGVQGHRFNCVSPGYINVTTTQAALSEKKADSIINRIPLRSFGDVFSIYQAVKLLIEAPYMNGAIIPVDGGYSI